MNNHMQLLRLGLWIAIAWKLIDITFFFRAISSYEYTLISNLSWPLVIDILIVAVLILVQFRVADKKNNFYFIGFIVSLILIFGIPYLIYDIRSQLPVNIGFPGYKVALSLLAAVPATYGQKLVEFIFDYLRLQSVASSQKNEAQPTQSIQEIISNINHRYDQKSGLFQTSIRYLNKRTNLKKNTLIRKGEYADVWRSVDDKIIADISISVSRPISSMDYREREACRVFELAMAGGLLSEKRKHNIGAALAWGDGKASIDRYNYVISKLQGYDSYKSDPLADSATTAMEWFMKSACNCPNVDTAISELLRVVDTASENQPHNPVVKEIKRRLEAGNAWLDGAQFEGTHFANRPIKGDGLHLGKTLDEINCWFNGEGSLITVAPPGSGKTQAHVIPNLISWQGPAVILDVKGELWDKTAAYRATLGPVYKFSPLDPDNSHSFNPLTLIRNEPDYIWEDCKYLADLMVVRSEAKDPFWESRAQDLITAAIAAECLNKPPEDRDMANVVGYCYGRDWTDMLAILSTAPVNAMKNAAEGWINTTGSSEKTLDGIRQQAQTFMSAWEGSRVERATRQSDWHPLDLRDEKPVTLYISLKAGEIDAYASLLRVFIGLHIRTLIHELPPHEAQNILFMLDELPRLKYMPPIEEALELGRQYKIKLFMVIQSLGQLKKHYKNADGLIGSCAVQSYMNPSSSDGTAEHLTKILGQVESIVDGSRRQLVEISDLTGPDYKDKTLILSAGSKPLKVQKVFAYQNDNLIKWMDTPPPQIKDTNPVQENTDHSTKGVY